jgi:hypothetical protein
VPDQASVIAVIAGVVLAAVAGSFLRARADRRALRELHESKKLSAEVIRSAEQMLTLAAQPEARALLLDDDARFHAAVRGLTARAPSTQVTAALAELEHARLQVLTAAVAHDEDYRESAARGLVEALDAFSAASSIMVRLAKVA